MRDDDPGPWPRIRGQGVDDGRLVLGVESAGPLVHQEHRRRFEKCPRDADRLAFAVGQRGAGLAHSQEVGSTSTSPRERLIEGMLSSLRNVRESPALIVVRHHAASDRCRDG